MKSLVYYDKTTGNIEDAKGVIIGTISSFMNVDNPVPESKSTDIDSLIKLKASGFTADDLIKMGVKL